MQYNLNKVKFVIDVLINKPYTPKVNKKENDMESKVVQFQNVLVEKDGFQFLIETVLYDNGKMFSREGSGGWERVITPEYLS